MSSDVDKQIAFEMTKAIIHARNDANIIGASALQYSEKIGDIDYWAEVYIKCLKEITKEVPDN